MNLMKLGYAPLLPKLAIEEEKREVDYVEGLFQKSV